MQESDLIKEFSKVLDTKIAEINKTSKTEIQKTIQDEFNRALIMIGIDANNPMIVQLDMQFVRAHRIDSEDTKKQIKNRAVNYVMTFLIFVLGLGLYEFISNKIILMFKGPIP